MTDPNVLFVRRAFEEFDRQQERLRQRVVEFTKYVNKCLDELTPTRRNDAADPA
jgi:hypothetical protein